MEVKNSSEKSTKERLEKSTSMNENSVTQVEQERGQFNALIASNPNYFGNLLKSSFKQVKKIVGNTKYEELTCLGFNPNLNLLEATVNLKLPTGYNGGLCYTGSTEYVRFYVDYGAGWEDAGMVSVSVHDLPNKNDCAKKPDKPLSYVLTQIIEPKRKNCMHPVMPTVRAILSWNSPPPAGEPDWPPVWGNVIERHIQIKPNLPLVFDLPHLLGVDVKVKLPPHLEIIKHEPIPLPDPPPFALKDLIQMYAKSSMAQSKANDVEPHRFATADLHPIIVGAYDQNVLSEKIAYFKDLGLNLEAIVAALEKTKGNVTYEELDCLGLDYNREWLVATFVIKKPSGYSGGLCSKGSKEYVSFWTDWDNECKWFYAGTASLEVHDITSIPDDGLHYTVIMPVDLSKHHQSCEMPKIARVRAVLSWNVEPSDTDPDKIPYWGNRLDTHVQIKPGGPYSITPKISVLGGIGVAYIFTGTTGMTKPLAPFAGWGPGVYADPWDPSRSCPFGGVIHVQSDPILGYKYKLWVQNVTEGGPEIQLKSPVWVTNSDGVGSLHYAGLDGMFDYLPPSQNIFSMLYSQWIPSGDDLWRVRLELFNSGGVLLGSSVGYRIQLDNTAPSADIHIDSGGDCKDFIVDKTVEGHFVTRDIHFGHYTISVLPSSMSPNSTVPSDGNSQTSLVGDSWNLSTSGMKPCGYVVYLHVWDRSIINSHPSLHNENHDDVGFCLRKPS
jgi:hypothetical protein